MQKRIALFPTPDKQCPDVFMLRGHNHLSPVLSFNTPDVELGNRVLAFMDRARRF